MKKIFLVFAILFLPIAVLGLTGDGTLEDPFEGDLTQNTIFGPGDIYIDGHIHTKEFRLTILPGTILRIYDGVSIYVESHGNIQAVGSESDPIVFTACYNNWGQVFSENGHLFF